MDTIARFAVRITVSRVGSASSPRRRGPGAKPSLTNRIVLRALPRLPRCVESAINADVAICVRTASIRAGEPAMKFFSNAFRGSYCPLRPSNVAIARAMDPPTIARQPDAEQRVERLYHDDEITRAQILSDKPADGLACAPHTFAGSNVILVQKNGEQARAAVRSFRLFIGARLNGLDRLIRRRASVGFYKANAIDGAGGAILEDLKILGPQAVNDAATPIRDDGVDSDQLRR
jgi:hypothetical protein